MNEPEVLECPLMGIEAAIRLVALVLLNKDPVDDGGAALGEAMRFTIRYCTKEICGFWVPEKKQCAVRAVFNKYI